MKKTKILALICSIAILFSTVHIFAEENILDSTEGTTDTFQRNTSQQVGDQRSCWVLEDGKYRYIKDNGEYAIGWMNIDNDKYYFDTNGNMVTGLQTIDGKTYFFHDGGGMSTGHVMLDGKRYYFNENGEMKTGILFESGKSYLYGEDGVYVGEAKRYMSNATAYSGDTITSTGQKPRWGTIAVDPRVIPYGSKVYLPYFNKTFVANDCGGAIKGTKIDIFMKSTRNMSNFGRRNINIYVVEPGK